MILLNSFALEGEKYEYYKHFRNDLMEELEKDPVLGVIDKARMI